ncbi:alanine aminotransferase, putative [Bodo saltans]|uniref:Alanine aminotransferase, putative n=1 Tax=Bodo saltans TaxID=75058 RepID=A0A0S4IKK8_BODSA|nr:alanine aminotransferase, putative [Bodo saltans]|eukprot:CUE64030.1 alanine aminotransferase, putative [Bodo saltans]
MFRKSSSQLAAYINPRVVQAQYAVRGLIPMRADELKARLDAGETLPFKELVYCNIGNPQALQQQPLTFNRQVMSLVDSPTLLENDAIVAQFPADVVARAKEYLKNINGMTGAYTDSIGYKWAREAIAQFIARRDGTESPDSRNICLTDGASSGVRLIMQLLIEGAKDGVLIPIPQYPLYTAQIALLGGASAMYYLDEAKRWDLHVEDLLKCNASLAATGATPRLLVVINPGNPTGQVLTKETMEGVVRYCHDNDVMLLADEVYQENIYGDRPFESFRKVVLGMPAPYNNTPCISLHSTSKGIIGECGRRGGYFEMLNVPKEQKEQLLKLCSINLCSNVNGQVMTALMCTPPAEGGESYARFRDEYDGIFASLKGRAEALAKELNGIEGITCNAVDGAMYAFPQIRLPAKYVARNEDLNKSAGTKIAADARWALELLEETGIVVVPGSGFLQQEGTFHFRTTILPPAEQMQSMTSSIRAFQTKINKNFAN